MINAIIIATDLFAVVLTVAIQAWYFRLGSHWDDYPIRGLSRRVLAWAAFAVPVTYGWLVVAAARGSWGALAAALMITTYATVFSLLWLDF